MSVVLVSKEGERRVVSQGVAEAGKVVKTILSEEVKEEDGEAEEIPLPNVSTLILDEVIAFMEMNAQEEMRVLPRPLPSSGLEGCVQECFLSFVNRLSWEVLFEVVLAANYLEVDGLLNLTCAKIATVVKGKSPEELNELFRSESPLVAMSALVSSSAPSV